MTSHDLHLFPTDLKMLYLMMESGQDIRIPSMLFLHTLHAVKPEFAHKDEKTGEWVWSRDWGCGHVIRCLIT